LQNEKNVKGGFIIAAWAKYNDDDNDMPYDIIDAMVVDLLERRHFLSKTLLNSLKSNQF
jgi:hypothetical protein